MEPVARKIEVFAPFGAALDRTKKILFQPFDLKKWCVIGFAAFLASLGGGGFNSFNPFGGDFDLKGKTQETWDGFGGLPAVEPWMIALVVIIGVIVLALVVVMTWLGARGQFMFLDCVVRDRAAIAEPWKEYRREGNSLFLLRLLVAGLFLALLVTAGAPLWWPFVLRGEAPSGANLVVGLIVLVLTFGIALIIWSMVSTFVAPIMYRQRVRAFPALRRTVGLILEEPGPVILFFLFTIVLGIGMAAAACVATCATCCIAAIPYVGTVILLPLPVFWTNYVLLFLRQFGPEYDAWGALALSEPAPPVPETPAPPNEPPAAPPLQ